MRSFVLLLLCLLVSQTTGLAALTEPEDCDETCPDDDPGGTCPPICPSCTCLSHSTLSVLMARNLVLVPDEPPVVPPPSASARAIPSPDPREILHVPKPLLA